MFKLLQINFVLFLLIFSSLVLDVLCISAKKQSTSTLKQSRTSITEEDENWKLVWRDEFDYKSYDDFTENWSVANDAKLECSGFLQVSCNNENNVQLNDGYLVLKANYDKKSDQFLSAAVDSKKYFGEGRYEIRAVLPSPDDTGLARRLIRTSFLTKSSTEKYWHQTGQFDILSYSKAPTIHRTVHVEKGVYGAIGDDFDAKGVILNDFHRFGVEWNQTDARFYFDQIYGRDINLFPGNFLSQKQQIRLQISVGGVHFQPKLTKKENEAEDFIRNYRPSDFRPNFNFYNPAEFVIDYVRIYERIH